MPQSSPLERTSVQLMLFVAGVALFANSAVDRTDDGRPWEVTLTGFCVFAVVFGAIYARKIEVALSIVRHALPRPHGKFCCEPNDPLSPLLVAA